MSNLTAWERWELGNLDDTTKSSHKTEDDAEEVRLPTVDEVEAIREQARKEGFDAGYAEGREAAMAEAQRLAVTVKKLDAAFEGIEGQVADELLALAVEIGRQVVRGEITARPESLLDVVREALAQLPHQHAAVFLNPDDASLVRSYIGDQLGHAGHRINEDPQLKRGDCVVESGSSQVDATVATRWRRIIESLGVDAAWAVTDKAVEKLDEPK